MGKHKGRTPPPPLAGLGISRADFQQKYEELGFTFEVVDDQRGQRRTMGTTATAQAQVVTIGPDDNLTQVGVLIPALKADTNASRLNSLALVELTTAVLPDWEDGPRWVNQRTSAALERGKVSVRHGPILVTLTFYKGTGLVDLTIRAER